MGHFRKNPAPRGNDGRGRTRDRGTRDRRHAGGAHGSPRIPRGSHRYRTQTPAHAMISTLRFGTRTGRPAPRAPPSFARRRRNGATHSRKQSPAGVRRVDDGRVLVPKAIADHPPYRSITSRIEGMDIRRVGSTSVAVKRRRIGPRGTDDLQHRERVDQTPGHQVVIVPDRRDRSFRPAYPLEEREEPHRWNPGPSGKSARRDAF
jgi:hypothetical protein